MFLSAWTTGELFKQASISPCNLSVKPVKPLRRHSWPGGCGLSTPAADSCAERATRCRGFHAPSLFCWFPLRPAEPLLGWINTGCSSTVPPRARSTALLSTGAPCPSHQTEKSVFGFVFKFTLSRCFVTFLRWRFAGCLQISWSQLFPLCGHRSWKILLRPLNGTVESEGMKWYCFSHLSYFYCRIIDCGL